MALRSTTQLGALGEELIGSFNRSGASALEEQVLQEAGPRRISDVLSFLDTAGQGAQGAFNAAEGTLGRQLRGLGVRQTDREQRVAQRRLGLSRALATVDARNRATGELRQRTDIARTSAASLRDALDSQVLGARGAAASAEAGREAEYQAALAEHERRKATGLGAAVGIGLSFLPGGGIAQGVFSG